MEKVKESKISNKESRSTNHANKQEKLTIFHSQRTSKQNVRFFFCKNTKYRSIHFQKFDKKS